MIDLNKYIQLITISYKYKKLKSAESRMVRNDYLRYIPSGFLIEGSSRPLYDLHGTLVSNGYDRIVVGDYGPYIEVSDEQIARANVKVKSGQEWRINNKKYSDTVKYWWLTSTSDSGVKIYLQRRPVEYADYRIGYYYILINEVRLERWEVRQNKGGVADIERVRSNNRDKWRKLRRNKAYRRRQHDV